MIGFYDFDLFSIMFFLVFSLIVLTFIVALVKAFNQWSFNKSQPVLDIDAKVVSKRTNISHHSGHTDSNGHHHHGHSSTTYYITFEVTGGDRMEFQISGKDYGLLVEGDIGTLKYQGTRFLSFNRAL